MKSHRKFTHLGYLAVAALFLFAGSAEVVAQRAENRKLPPSQAGAPRGGELASLLGQDVTAGGATPADFSLAGRQIIVPMPMESGYSSRLASPAFSSAEEITDEPRTVSLPSLEQDPALSFPDEGGGHWQPRATSAIPQGTRSGMYPGSRMRGPFEQTYPRPFPGGGQP